METTIIEGQISIFDLQIKNDFNDLKNRSTKSIDILNKKSNNKEKKYE